MTRFQDLSSELVLSILERSLPEDIDSISLVSKPIYQLAILGLERHRRLRKQYTKIENMVEHEPDSWHDPGGLLADLLCKIKSDTSIGHYVKKLDLSMWNNGARDGWKPDEVFERSVTTHRTRLQQDSKTNMDIIEEAIRAMEIIPTEEVDDWLHQIRLGNEDPLVALLFLHAPALHTLQFVAPYNRRESSYLLRTIQRVAGQGCAVKPHPSHLKNVEIHCAEGWENLDFIKAFISLPSLTSIKTNNLFVDGRRHRAKSAILPKPSNVSEFSVSNGFLPEKAISELLQGVKNLRIFAYNITNLWHDEDYTSKFDCLAVMNSLEANASHTLEHLKLGAPGVEASQIAPIRRFHALREIEIETSCCLAVEGSKIANLVSVLPVSVERLAICWHEATSVDGIGTLTEAILGLVRDSKTQLPSLRMLHVGTMDQGESDALWDCLGSDETAQINPLLSFKIQGPNSIEEIPAWVDNVCTCGQDCFGTNSQHGGN
ncbi:MAG: hypothetical protein ASARMPRED_008667 [Alectoria sarmentosa]|nr:MAG: hypothetical protein ASARMPRED_008667 [Alectoria sarmentosa]